MHVIQLKTWRWNAQPGLPGGRGSVYLRVKGGDRKEEAEVGVMATAGRPP